MEEGERDCCTLLFPVFTENGFCFAFNLNYTAHDWPMCVNAFAFADDIIT